MTLDELGMSGTSRARFEASLQQSWGAVLVTGPTGSGKTTTLYGALQLLNGGERSIVTVEDPVEYEISNAKQMQLHARAGLTFANALRTLMRADPDIVMVGEVRDTETARIAIEAALTGHLVLSTLHTNDAPSATVRLTEMGIEPYLLASAVRCVVAQRLVRRLCDACRLPVVLSASVLRDCGFDAAEDEIEAWDAAGCPRCAGTGYRGRLGVYEVLNIDAQIRELILRGADAASIGRVASEGGMVRLRADAREKLLAGATSLAEVTRVLGRSG
jgi:type IV pilus assembly protein PilB